MPTAQTTSAQSLGRLGNVSGALLLGGASRRMGRDKAHIDWRGKSWAMRMAEVLEALFTETLLVGGDPARTLPGRRVSDGVGPVCAMRGLVAALDAATSDRVVIVATDMPLLEPDLLLALCAWPEADAVVPVDQGGEQPLCAIYRREVCLQAARRCLESNQLSLRGLLETIETSRVRLAELGFDPAEALQLTNVNTPGDLARLEGR